MPLPSRQRHTTPCSRPAPISTARHPAPISTPLPSRPLNATLLATATNPSRRPQIDKLVTKEELASKAKHEMQLTWTMRFNKAKYL